MSKDKQRKQRKPPKDLDQYVPGVMAGAQLIDAALQNLIALRPGVLAKWELKLHYYHTPKFMARYPDTIFTVNSSMLRSRTFEIDPEDVGSIEGDPDDFVVEQGEVDEG